NLPPQAGNPEVAQSFLDEAQSELADAEAELLAATQVFIMENLSAGETNALVDGENANANITFIAGAGNLDDAQASNYTLNLEVDGDEYDSTFTINDFGTVNLSLIDVEGTEDHYEFG